MSNAIKQSRDNLLNFNLTKLRCVQFSLKKQNAGLPGPENRTTDCEMQVKDIRTQISSFLSPENQ